MSSRAVKRIAANLKQGTVVVVIGIGLTTVISRGLRVAIRSLITLVLAHGVRMWVLRAMAASVAAMDATVFGSAMAMTR